MDLFRWFSGGDEQYMTLRCCMKHDAVWIAVVASLSALVLIGYAVIAWHWSRNARLVPDGPAKRALRRMQNIFLLCAYCGYGFVLLKLVWPAWRLQAAVLVVLAYQTIRYAIGTNSMSVVYAELGDAARLRGEIGGLQRQLDDAMARLRALSPPGVNPAPQ